MTNETKQRIEKEARLYADSIGNIDGTASFDYKRGATAEHTRARNEGLEVAIKRLESEIASWLIVYPNPLPGSPASYGIDSLNQAIRNIREIDFKR